MRMAPIHQAEFAYKQGDKWVPGILAERQEVAMFVEAHMKRIWQRHLHKIMDAQIWGWSGLEVTYRLKRKRLVLSKMLHRHAVDVFARVKDGEVGGVTFKNVKGKGSVPLEMPQCMWHAYKPKGESPYGKSALLGCFQPWADKQTNGGALDVRRLFMVKDAYGGISLGYPAGTTQLEAGADPTPNQNIARQIAEQAASGHVMVFPSEVDANGNRLWPIEYANVPNNPSHILAYPKDLDTEILRGLEIPDDVLTSEATGAWQGKQVPMLAFFTQAEIWMSDIICDIVEQIIEPLVEVNFGPDQAFEVQTKPLAQQAMEQMEGNQQPMQLPQNFQMDQGNVRQLGLTVANMVGQGVIDASVLVKAAQNYLDSAA
jgi:hypothetical protein